MQQYIITEAGARKTPTHASWTSPSPGQLIQNLQRQKKNTLRLITDWRRTQEASNGFGKTLWVGQMDNWLKEFMKEQLKIINQKDLR